MTSGTTVDRLREFLSELSPKATVTLLNQLERAALAGDEVTGLDIVLKELRREMRRTGAPAPRIGNPARLFFMPAEPFFVDEATTYKQRGRIARTSLMPIWTWIARDLMREEAATYSDDVVAALIRSADDEVKAHVGAFQDSVVTAISAVLDGLEADPAGKQRLMAQLGSPRVVEDAADLITVMSRRDTLADFAGSLPILVKNLADEEVEGLRSKVETAFPDDPALFDHALVLLMLRMAQPWQMVRLAVHATGSDQAALIAEDRWASAVLVIINEVERAVIRLGAVLKTSDRAAAIMLVRDLHDRIRGLRSEMDLSSDTAWSRRIAAVRTEVGRLLKAEIDGIPGRIRKMLKPRTGDAGATLDLREVKDLEGAMDLLATCRTCAAEIGLSEGSIRVYSELQTLLDTGTTALLDGLSDTSGPERRYRMSQIDAAVRFSAKIFGSSYAALLSKAAEVAATGDKRRA